MIPDYKKNPFSFVKPAGSIGLVRITEPLQQAACAVNSCSAMHGTIPNRSSGSAPGACDMMTGHNDPPSFYCITLMQQWRGICETVVPVTQTDSKGQA